MELAALVVAIVLVVILVRRGTVPLGVPTPIALLVVGAVLSFVPAVPEVPLSSELVLFGLLPPLLYAAALSTSLLDVRTHRAAILSLSVGLVLFTALGVGVVAWLLLPIPFTLAFALGAIVAPPDAVAATAVARRIGLPRGITTILEGESLLNDATALVSLRTALAAAGLAAHGVGAGEGGEGSAAEVTLGSVSVDLLVASVGGVAIGVVAYLVIGTIRRYLITEVPADTALSFVAPYLSYVPAEQVGASGVLAVVTTGLLLAHRAPELQTAPSRLSEKINWSSVTFVLENAVFLLIGLQIASLVDNVGKGELSLSRTLLVGLAVLVTCLVLRPVWMVPFTLLGARHSKDRGERVRSALVGSWAGMRGVVTLAAALTLPEETPLRAELVLIALVVTVGTLLLQGTTLPMLARALDVRGPDPREDALQEATVLGATTGAGLRLIESDPDADAAVVRAIQEQASARVNRSWERLGMLGQGDDETPSESHVRLRTAMIREERAELLRIRDLGAVDHAVLNTVLGQLDAEETALVWSATRSETVRGAPLRPPERIAGACEHLAAAEIPRPPTSADGCSTCLELGMRWVHLRACAACGHVGCCDSSQGKHASAHFRDAGHPVMRSIEPGEAWRWCFVDEVLG
ncbi:MAG TPA: cation:proton antiporter [Ornithinibacter sp.]|nr:cation:proton antiporter [Ornithinibacter sp.]